MLYRIFFPVVILKNNNNNNFLVVPCCFPNKRRKQIPKCFDGGEQSLSGPIFFLLHCRPSNMCIFKTKKRKRVGNNLHLSRAHLTTVSENTPWVFMFLVALVSCRTTRKQTRKSFFLEIVILEMKTQKNPKASLA